MSAAIEEREVIVIPTQTNNQDGSQTFLILDPCQPEETLEEPKLEIVDLSAAEVTNTGAIAVVSTNSTGALEITLTNKSSPIQMENGNKKPEPMEIVDDDSVVVKKEEEEVDVEDIEESDAQNSKVDSIASQPKDACSREEPSQEDDADEGVLYIDEVKCAEDEAPAKTDKLTSEIEGTLEQNMKNMIEQAEILFKETESTLEGLKEDKAKEDKANNDKDEVVPEALLQNSVVNKPSSETTESKTELDSTNTALTLLELAGSTFIVPDMENPSESSSKAPEKAKLIAVSSDGNKDEKLTEVATLTLPVTLSTETTVEVDQTSVSTLNPEVLRSARQWERLKEGDNPSIANRRSVTNKEIAAEIVERTKNKYPDLESSGDYIFAMKLAHRLATKIVVEKPEDGSQVSEETKTESNQKSITENSSVLNKPTPAKETPATVVKAQKPTVKSHPKSSISDKIELLRILEDDPDDPDPTIQPQLDKIEVKPRIASKRKSHLTPLLKLHPQLEKELALQQLQEFQTPRKKKRSVEVAKSEHNNNTRGRKKQSLARNQVDSSTATAAVSQVTEFLTVEGQEFIGEQLKDSRLVKQYSNKRLSRSETPPLDLPMDLLLNGVEDGEEEKAKNKIFKATNPRKRKVELQIKKRNHLNNVLQRNKPQKRRGRPPKKKPVLPPDDMHTLEILHKATTRQEKPKNGLDKPEPVDKPNTEESPSSSKGEKTTPKTKKMREIDRLLGDEGAINLLFAIEQEKQNAGGNAKRGILPSVRRKKKDLILKTKLVKSAVLRLTNPSLAAAKISLRGQQPKEEAVSNDAVERKMSVDSHDSHSIGSPPPADMFPFPAKIVPAEASRIIRRHSSSSNYSSRSNSPRRLSVDGERTLMSPEPGTPQEVGQGDAPTSSPATTPSSKHRSPKSSPQVVRKLELNPEVTVKQETSREKKKFDKVQADKLARELLKPKRGRPSRKYMAVVDSLNKAAALDESLAAVIDDFRGTENVDKNIPPGSTRKSTTAAVASFVNRTIKPRQTPSTQKPSVVYKELTLKRTNHLVEIMISPVSTKLKNALNTSVLRELTSVLTGLTKDDNCRVVVLSSTGTVFCQGIDFLSLINEGGDKKTPLETAIAIKEFIKALALFSKVIVAAVQGAAVGLGVTMLPLFDLVLATDTATFTTPYAKLGQVPEGGATLTMPTLLGPAVTSELLYSCRKLTAAEAHNYGLVTRILPQKDFAEHVSAVVTSIAAQSSQAMEATKGLMRHSLQVSLETALVSETHLLVQQWSGEECQNNFSKYLQASQPLPFTLQHQEPST